MVVDIFYPCPIHWTNGGVKNREMLSVGYRRNFGEVNLKYPTPVKSIRKYCLECSGGSYLEAKQCVVTDCPLYPYRLGKSPNRVRGGGGIRSQKHPTRKATRLQGGHNDVPTNKR